MPAWRPVQRLCISIAGQSPLQGGTVILVGFQNVILGHIFEKYLHFLSNLITASPCSFTILNMWVVSILCFLSSTSFGRVEFQYPAKPSVRPRCLLGVDGHEDHLLQRERVALHLRVDAVVPL